MQKIDKNFFNKKVIVVGLVVFVLVFSQWLMVKMVYAHQLSGAPARWVANFYNLKAGMIEDNGQEISIPLEDFLANQSFAKRLLAAQSSGNQPLGNLNVEDKEIDDLVWSKLLKQAWLNKIANEYDIGLTQEDIDYYISVVGGTEEIEKIIEENGISFDEYQYFLIEPDMLEAKVYNYLLFNFADDKGVAKIQEAYALLESENGENWQEVAEQYSEDDVLSQSTFWLKDSELVGVYEAISEVGVGEFSKIVQVPGGYIIWYVNSVAEEDNQAMKEVSGLFIYAQSVDDFFDKYLESVEVNRKY